MSVAGCPLKPTRFTRFIFHNSYLHYCICSLPQLMAKRLARPRHRPHGITAVVHARRSWPCSDILRVLLLGKWHRLLWCHPAICHGGWARSKHARSAMHGWLLWSHLLFEPHLLHLLLNLCNLKITKYKFVHYDLITLMPNNIDWSKFQLSAKSNYYTFWLVNDLKPGHLSKYYQKCFHFCIVVVTSTGFTQNFKRKILWLLIQFYNFKMRWKQWVKCPTGWIFWCLTQSCLNFY